MVTLIPNIFLLCEDYGQSNTTLFETTQVFQPNTSH